MASSIARPGVALLVLVPLAACGSSKPGARGAYDLPASAEGLVHPEEVHFGEIVQLTRGAGENAEAYWSQDGEELVFQSKRPPYECDQIFRVPADGSGEPTLVSTGEGRTTCAYFLPAGDRIVYSSTHLAGPECPPVPDMSQGYVWPIYPSYDIFSARPDGSDLQRLTDEPGYDAEATVCPVDGSILFTSTRDGDLDLYRMDADGSNVVRLTSEPGYDGGGFFSPDCSKIVWRASRPEGDQLADYRRLLAQDRVRPGQLEVWVADADGGNARQVTHLGAASFAPYFHPSGERILFSTNYPDARGREFDIWAIDVDGTDLERITHRDGFDGFPMFSPDGTRLAFGSNRNQAAEGETDVYVVEWRDEAQGTILQTEADRFAADVAWLADDAREGRGVGTAGIDQAAEWIAARLADAGAEPGLEGGYLQELTVPVSVARGDGTALAIGKRKVPGDAFVPAAFSAEGRVAARSVYVGYGRVGHGVDDYAGKNVQGNVVVIRRGPFDAPSGGAGEPEERRFSTAMHFKAFTAREKGAAAVVFVDVAEEEGADEAPLPELRVARHAEIGIPVVIATRDAATPLTRRPRTVTVEVDLDRVEEPTSNVVGVIRAGAEDRLPGAIVVGAHYDHLGFGSESSLAPGERAVHNGADDNASGVAGLLEVARRLEPRQTELRRDVYLVAFTGEESGLLGSSHFVRTPPPGLDVGKDVVAMLNMDMIGRIRNNTVAVLGGATATEWPSLVEPACAAAGIRCELGGGGYGPSDQTKFYAAGVPVLQWFTGSHGDYHKPSDDAARVHAGGGARIAWSVAEVAASLAGHEGRLSYQKVAAPRPGGDVRSFGASLGTIPDYAAGDDRPGVLLAGVRPGGPAEEGGLRAGDRIRRIGETEVRSVQDLVYVLRSAEPGETATVVVERDGAEVELEVTYGTARRRRGR